MTFNILHSDSACETFNTFKIVLKELWPKSQLNKNEK